MRKGLGFARFLLFLIIGPAMVWAEVPTIEVNAAQVIGKVSPYIFGQNLEHEHGAISGGEQNMNNAHGLHTGGLWAEMLRDRKFEQGDLDKDGVSNAWVPEERITNRYWQLNASQGIKHRYYIDHDEYYGGGAAQAIEVYGSSSSISQVFLWLSKGRRYAFYVYLKRRGQGTARVDFENVTGTRYERQEFSQLAEQWARYTAEFTAPEDTSMGRVRISVQGTGTFWIDSASLMPADNLRGMRRDVVEALKPLRVPLLRYPGGCFADIYHWKDGIGPRDQRPERFSTMWNEWEPNDFGTDELMDFAKEIGSDVHITTNYLTATPEEAGEWAEYTNGLAQTPMGRLRAHNGHPEPYGIKIWAVGNEAQKLCSDVYFSASDVNEYAQRFQQYKATIQKADPSIRVVAAGAPPGPLKWNRDLFGLASFDLLATSVYTLKREPMKKIESLPAMPIDDYDTKIMDLDHFYRHVVGEPMDFAGRLERIISGIGDRLPNDHPPIAIAEFQSWWVSEKVDADFRLANALYLAGVYHELMRRARQVSIAEIESLINVQGVIEVSQSSLKLTPEYFACVLYRNHTGSSVLSTVTKSPMVSFNPQLPVLDSLATLSDDGQTFYLSVINRNEADDLSASIQVRSWTPQSGSTGRIFELNGKNKDAANPFGSSENVNIRNKSIIVDGASFAYCFPAHSVTIIEISGTR